MESLADYLLYYQQQDNINLAKEILNMGYQNSDGSVTIGSDCIQSILSGNLANGTIRDFSYSQVKTLLNRQKEYIKHKPPKGIIVAGFGGLGKSYISKNYPNTIDIDSIFFAYKLPSSVPFDEESFKSTDGRTIKPNWEQDYVDAVVTACKYYDVVLVGMQDFLLDYLQEHNLPYYLAYPETDYMDELEQRYINRGNNKRFVETSAKIIGQWRKKLNNFKPVKLLLIGKDEYLSDVLIKEKIL